MDKKDSNLEKMRHDFEEIIYYLHNKERRLGQNIAVIIRDYISENYKILKKAADDFEEYPSQKKKELHEKYNLYESLNYDGWYSNIISCLDYSIKYKKYDPKNKTKLLHYNASDLELVERMLGYAVYISDTSEYQVKYHPIEKYLPREFKKLVMLLWNDSHYQATVTVEGGLTWENRKVFEKVESKFPKALNLSKRAEAAENHDSEIPDSYTEPFRVILNVPKESVEKTIRIFKKNGFQIEKSI